MRERLLLALVGFFWTGLFAADAQAQLIGRRTVNNTTIIQQGGGAASAAVVGGRRAGVVASTGGVPAPVGLSAHGIHNAAFFDRRFNTFPVYSGRSFGFSGGSYYAGRSFDPGYGYYAAPAPALSYAASYYQADPGYYSAPLTYRYLLAPPAPVQRAADPVTILPPPAPPVASAVTVTVRIEGLTP